jgi:hydrogenase/urease accessory protein HupE
MHRLAVRFLVAAALTAGLCAHDPGLSSVHVTRSAAGVHVHAAFANADAAIATGLDADRDGAVDAAELTAGRTLLAGRVEREFVLRTAGATAPLRLVDAVLAENRDLELRLAADGVAPDAEVVLAIDLLQHLARGHRCYAAAVGDADTILADALLTVQTRSFVWPAATAGVAAPGGGSGLQFFALGVEHILIGWDHLAFLLALLVATPRLRAAVATITAFTVAHSVTLAAAALGVVHLPVGPVELAIAASIVVAAGLNLAPLRGRWLHRWPLAFAFGLVHGFGFANVLAELRVGGGDIATPLLTFNLGVEVGQVVFAAVVLPLLAWWARRAGTRRVAIAVSLAVGAVGAFWSFERLGT